MAGIGAEVGAAHVSVVPEAKGFGQKLTSQVGPEADKAGKDIGGKISGAMKGAMALVGGAAVLSFLKDSIGEAREAQKVGAATEAVIKSTGGAAKITAGQVGDLASAISAKSGIDDEAIQSGANMLLTFKNIRNEAGKGNDIFSQATQTITDMSVAFGTDASQSAIQLGKALNDPIAGISALGRVGVTFTDQQKAQIKTLVETGDTLSAQKIILKELNSEFGGMAAAQATAGDKAAVAWGNFKESVGTALLPILDELLKKGMEILPALEKLGPALLPFISAAGDLAGGALSIAIPLLSAFGSAVNALVDIVPGGATTIIAFGVAWKLLQAATAQTNGVSAMDNFAAAAGRFTGQATGSSDAAMRAQRTFSTLGSVMRGAAVAIPLAGVAIGVVGALFQAQEARTQASIDSFTKLWGAMREGGAAAKSAQAALAQVNTQIDKFAAGSQLQAAVAADLKSNMQAGKKAADESYASMSVGQQKQLALTAATNDYSLAVEKYGSGSAQAAAAQATLQAANSATKSSQDQVTAAMQGTTEALQTYMNQQLAAVSADFALQSAQLATQAAQATYNATLVDGTKSATDKQQAEIALGNAVLSGAQAAATKATKEAEAAGVTDTASAANQALLGYLNDYVATAGGNVPAAIQTMIGKLQSQAGQQAATGASADTTAGQIAGVGTAVNNLPASKTVTIYAQTGSALQALEIMQNTINSMTGKTIYQEVVTKYSSQGQMGLGSGPNGEVLASGGYVTGPGTGTSDSIPAMISNGEFVVNAAATSANLALLHSINNGRGARRFANGGPVAAAPVRQAAPSYSGPRELVIIDADRQLIGRMRIEADGVIDGYDSRTQLVASTRRTA